MLVKVVSSGGSELEEDAMVGLRMILYIAGLTSVSDVIVVPLQALQAESVLVTGMATGLHLPRFVSGSFENFSLGANTDTLN